MVSREGQMRTGIAIVREMGVGQAAGHSPVICLREELAPLDRQVFRCTLARTRDS